MIPASSFELEIALISQLMDIVSELGDNFSTGEGHTPRIWNTDTSLLEGRAPFS
jgi:predicted nuclease of restriction endonuclease-like (RecB) superfamily